MYDRRRKRVPEPVDGLTDVGPNIEYDGVQVPAQESSHVNERISYRLILHEIE